jgi:hypothetical protein
MDLTSGRGEITVGIIDGPASTHHPAFSGSKIHEIEGGLPASCLAEASLACVHGTCVIGMLASNRASGAPAICPGCSFIIRPVFAGTADSDDRMPVCSPVELAKAIVECVDAGTNVINVSAALVRSSLPGERELVQALRVRLPGFLVEEEVGLDDMIRKTTYAGGGASTMFTSGSTGKINYTVSSGALAPVASLPTCVESGYCTQETSNATYGTLLACPQQSITQSFSA